MSFLRCDLCLDVLAWVETCHFYAGNTRRVSTLLSHAVELLDEEDLSQVEPESIRVAIAILNEVIPTLESSTNELIYELSRTLASLSESIEAVDRVSKGGTAL